jgi:hypothetical protein
MHESCIIRIRQLPPNSYPWVEGGLGAAGEWQIMTVIGAKPLGYTLLYEIR